MGVDGVGKGGGGVGGVRPEPGVAHVATPRIEASDVSAPPFAAHLQATSSPATAGVALAHDPTPLARYRAGEIDFQGYVETKIDEATAHLRGLPAVDLAELRAALREQIASDSALADLVQTATGRAPSASED